MTLIPHALSRAARAESVIVVIPVIVIVIIVVLVTVIVIVIVIVIVVMTTDWWTQQRRAGLVNVDDLSLRRRSGRGTVGRVYGSPGHRGVWSSQR